MENPLLKLNNQLCFRLYSVSRNMTRLYKPFLDQFHLTYPQYIVMLVLFEQRNIDFKELSEVVDLRTATLTPIINKLVEIGYVEKHKNTSDSRRFDVVLSDKGKELQNKIVSVPLSMAEKLPITEDMYHVLVKELDMLSSILKNAQVVKNDK